MQQSEIIFTNNERMWRLSTPLSGIGVRLREIRRINELTQQVVAAAIDVTDRTYKNYEQEKRDLPSAAAVEISRRFGVSLVWLLTGQGNSTSGDDPELAASCSFAVLSEAQLRSADLEIEKLSKIIGFVAEQAAQTGEHPSGVAKKYFDTL